ncbi:MAG: histidine kinase dimerization/phospho-acceptor domain-containing protein, partial [Pseudomonadota bacterium]
MSSDRKILIVDNDVESCSLMRAVIANYKFDFPTEVYTSSDLNEADHLIKQITPDCIICGCGVSDLIPWTQKINSDAVKILLSENADFDELQNAVNKGGIFRFVFKPWNEEELCSAVAGSIEYLDISRENSGLVAKAEAKNRYLMKLKAMLENKDAEQNTRIERSEQTVKNVKTEFEITNRLLRAMNNVRSTADIEKRLKEILYDAMDIEDVKISPYKKTGGTGLDEKCLSVPLFCSGCILGEISFYRVALFDPSEVELLDKTADLVAMTADKLIRFSSLERLKKQWEAVFDSIDVPLTVVDKDLNLTRANRSFGEMVGEKVQNIIGKKCFNVLRNVGNGTQCSGCNVRDSFETAKPVGSEVNVEHSGKCFTTWTYPVCVDGRVNSAVQFYKDISEQKNYREKLLHSEKLAEIGILAGSVAHEINNPIGGIIAMLQIISHEMEKNSPIAEDIQEMEKAAGRCKKIVDNLLHFSRQSKEDEAKVMELSSVFNSLMPLVDIQIRHENIDFSFTDETNG